MSSTVQGLRQSLFTAALSQANMHLYVVFLLDKYAGTTSPEQGDEPYWLHWATDSGTTPWDLGGIVGDAVDSWLDERSWNNLDE